MKKKILFLLILFMPFMVSAEELKLNWQKAYESLESISPTKDGGFIEASSITTYSDGKRSITSGYIEKFDSNGVIVWQKQYDYDKGSSWFNNIIETKEGDFVAIGSIVEIDESKWPINESEKAIMVKYNKEGNILWEKEWGGNDEDRLTNLIEMQDGSFVVIGYTRSTDIDNITLKGDSDVVIIKLDKNGNILWKKNWGGSALSSNYYYGNPEIINDIIYAGNDSFIVVGYISSNDVDEVLNKGSRDAIIIKYDGSGNQLWQKSWGGKSHDYFNSVIKTETGEYVVVGFSNSSDIENVNGEYGSGIIIKYDENGQLLWQSMYSEGEDIKYYDIIEVKKNGYIVVGDPYNLCPDGLIAMYDYNGEMIWKKYWEERNNEYDDYLYQIVKLLNGNFIIRGETDSNNFENNISDSRNYKRMLISYSFEYNLENVTNENNNGTSTVEQQGRYGIVKPTPNEGYEVDKIIVKDKSGNVLDVEVTKLEDGTYSFELYTDVSVEVLFKEKLVNPKTGVSSFIGVIFTLMLIGISGFFMIRNCNNNYEL